MHQNKRWSPTLRHLVKLILGCHIVRLPLPTLHLEQTLGEWRKTIQENEYNGTFNQSGHQTQLMAYIYFAGKNGNIEYLLVYPVSLVGREFHTFNCFCFVYVPKKPFWKYNHCSAGPQIMTWHDLTFMSESILAMSKSTNWPMSKYCQVINNVQHIKGTERRFKIGLSPIPEIAEENLSMKSFYLRCSDLSHQLILKQGTTTADDQM